MMDMGYPLHLIDFLAKMYRKQLAKAPSTPAKMLKKHHRMLQVERCFDTVDGFGNTVTGFGNSGERNFVLSTKSKKLNMFNLFRLGNNVEERFDFVAGTLSEWFHVKKGVRQGCFLSTYSFNVLAEMVMRVMKETLDRFEGGLQIGGPIVTNLRYAYDIDIILWATSEAELQELVDRPDQLSRKQSLLINVDKTKVMASDGIACRILIQKEQLELHIYR